jgi:diguanylate cyclase
VDNLDKQAADKWKQKYLDTLDQYERFEKRASNLQQLLGKVAAKLCIAAQGQDDELDSRLHQLRDQLRDDINAGLVEQKLTGLESRMMTFDQERQARQQRSLEALAQLNQQLRALPLPKDVDKALKAMEKPMRNVRGTPPLEQWLTQMAQLQQQAFASISTPAAQKTSLWQRLLGARDASETAADKSDVPHAGQTPAPPVSSANTHATTAMAGGEVTTPVSSQQNNTQESNASAGNGHIDFAAIHSEAARQLLELLNQIEPPEIVAAQAEALRSRLQKGLNAYELISALEQSNIVVLAALDRDQRDFETFLKSLDNRLTAVQEFLQVSQEERKATLDESRKLDQAVRDKVSSLHTDVDEAHDLESLKSRVRSNLEHIMTSLDSFRDFQQQQEAPLADQLAALVARVATMEDESRLARDNLEAQKARLLRDTLTELPNREAYNQRLEQEFARWQRYKRALSFVVCDVDFFKKVNDAYGHLAGDKVLRVIGKTLAKRLRKTDFIARFGGEEFVLLLPETDAQAALKTVETLREAIAQCPFHFKDQRVGVTMSFGVTELRDGDTAERAFERADQALYLAKNNGRNRCELT